MIRSERLLAENAALRRKLRELQARLDEVETRNPGHSETFAAVLHILPDMIFILGRDGRYLQVFTGNENLLYMSMKEVLGRTIHDILPPEVNTPIQAVIDQTLATGEPQTMDYSLDLPDGTTRWFNGSTRPMEYESEPCVLWVARDVTERKLAEQETQRARDAAIESNRLKSQFLANISHEIRTPLSGIIGCAQLLEQTDLGAAQREYAVHIQECSQALLELVNDILDFSKIEANRLSLAAEPFEPRGMLNALVELFRLQARDRPLRYRCELDDAIPKLVIGDRNRLRQILINLLGNATKFSPAGEVAVRASLESRHDEELRVRFEVEDTGIGMSEEALSRIFEPFVQADGSAARTYEGAGLGLSIVKQLLTLMDGDIRVHSTLNKGTRFEFIVPLLAHASDDQTGADGHEHGSADTSRPATTPAAQRAARILLAEDNPVGQRIMEKMLANMGHECHIAANGQLALEHLADTPFDIVFMDCQMPVLDGYETTRRIREREPSDRRIPIIALTAHATQGAREQCIEAGMDDYLSKPIMLPDLAAMLERWT